MATDPRRASEAAQQAAAVAANPWTGVVPTTGAEAMQGQGIYNWLDYLSTTATVPSLVNDALTSAFNLAKEARKNSRLVPDVDASLDPDEKAQYRSFERDLNNAKRFRAEMAAIYDGTPLRVSPLSKSEVSLRQSVIDDHLHKYGASDQNKAAANRVADHVLAILSGDADADKTFRPYIDRILGDVRDTTPVAAGASDEAFATLDQYEEWKRQARVNPNAPTPRFRLTEGGQKNWQRQRAYDFLRSLQDGQHAPPYASPVAPALQVGGAVGGIVTWPLTAAATNFGNLIDPALSQPFDSDKYFRGQADHIKMMGNTLYGGVRGRMDSALYWLDRGKDATATKDPQTGAMFPSRSVAGTAGFGDYFNNYANTYTNVNSSVEVPARNFEMGLGKIAAVRNARADLFRDTPLIPDESFRKKGSDALGNLSQHMGLQQQWLSANAPRAAYAVNDALGTKLQPRYLAPYEALGLALPQEVFGDLGSAAGIGKSLVSGLFDNPFKALAKTGKHIVSESGEEALPEYAMSLPEEAALAGEGEVQPDMVSWFSTAPNTITAIQGESGGIPATDRPAYEKGLAGYRKQRSDLAQSIEDYQKSSAWAKLMRDMKAGRPVPQWKVRSLRPTDQWTPSPIR